LITTMIVDDEEDMRTIVRVVLELAGDDYEVVGEAADGYEALARYEELDPPPDPEVVILDNRMPRLNGLETAREMFKRRPDQVVVLYSAYLDANLRRQATELGISACVAKNDVDELPGVIRRLLAS
jgi:two-component system chemotaxis response regulator CheY/response regulator NasT